MFKYDFMINAFAIGVLISILCTSIGLFAVLKGYSMIGDTLAHSALAGVAVGTLLGVNPLATAIGFSVSFGVLGEALRNSYKKHFELIMVIILSLGTGIALTIMSSGKLKSNINSFLFGSILTVSTNEIIMVLILTIVTILVVFIFYDKLIYATFDEEGAKVAGVNVKLVNYIYSILVAAAIAVNIKIVGVLVLSSMISLPTAAALQLKMSFKKTLIASFFFSFFNIISSLVLSYYLNLSTSGIIALVSVLTLLVVIVIKNIFFKS